MEIPKIPLGDWITWFIDYLTTTFGSLFGVVSEFLSAMGDAVSSGILAVPPLVIIGILTVLSWLVGRWTLSAVTLFGLLLILNLGYWEPAVDTFTLVLTSVVIALVIGLPLGISAGLNKKVNHAIEPVLDFMQTMPGFVYLIPAIFFFGLGVVPGVFASVIFAMPPAIRLTSLGIREVSGEFIEAADAFGSTPAQRLIHVQFPLAIPTIMTGINQTIMLSLSMVVIASMVGAPGLGTFVYQAVTQLDVGVGFEAGISIVILAVVLDRLSRNIGRRTERN